MLETESPVSTNLEKVGRLYDLVARRRSIEREERALKDYFIAMLKKRASLRFPGFVLTAVEKTRTQLSRALAVETLGEETTRTLEREVSWTEVNVVKKK